MRNFDILLYFRNLNAYTFLYNYLEIIKLYNFDHKSEDKKKINH